MARTVSIPPIESFGRLTQDKWLALKTLEEAAETVEAVKAWLRAPEALALGIIGLRRTCPTRQNGIVSRALADPIQGGVR